MRRATRKLLQLVAAILGNVHYQEATSFSVPARSGSASFDVQSTVLLLSSVLREFSSKHGVNHEKKTSPRRLSRKILRMSSLPSRAIFYLFTTRIHLRTRSIRMSTLISLAGKFGDAKNEATSLLLTHATKAEL